MDIRRISITEIDPAPYNPRIDLKPGDPDYEKIRKSIEAFDLVEPLVWNERTGTLIGGHQRLKVLRERGDTEVEVSAVDLEPDMERALNLALNKTGGDWDLPKLKDLLEELDTGDFDMDITGFDASEIEDLMTQFHVEGDDEEDEVPEPPEEPETKSGDLLELGPHRVLCGDATDGTTFAELMLDKKAHLFATDPPYGVAYGVETGVGSKFGAISNDENDGPRLQAFLEAVFQNAVGYLEDNAAWYLWHAQMTQGFFAAAAATAAAVIIHRQIIWVKPSLILGHGDYHWKHELCFYGWRQGHRPEWYGDRSQTTVWEVGRENDGVHPTQKPVELFERPIANNTKVGQLVLDPFLGSGTTLIAAEKLGRVCYGMEIDPRYCDVIKKRYENYVGQS